MTETPLYKDPNQPVDARIEDLLARMTLEEKVAQLICLWTNKEDVQEDDQSFSAEKASRLFPHGLGQIARPSDRRISGRQHTEVNRGHAKRHSIRMRSSVGRSNRPALASR